MSPTTAAKTIRYVAYGFIGFALIWGLAPYQGINWPSRALLDLLNWPFGDGAPVFTQSEMWLSSIGAGLTFAISIMLIGIVAPAAERMERNTIRVTMGAFIVWYLVDSIGSVASGVPSNAFFNLIFLAAILVPLVLIKSDDETG